MVYFSGSVVSLYVTGGVYFVPERIHLGRRNIELTAGSDQVG